MAGPLGRVTRNRDRQEAERAAFLLTFVCYGTRLPGQLGSVDRLHNRFGDRLPEANPGRVNRVIRTMRQPAYLLDDQRRRIVLGALRETCQRWGWTLLAAHVRTNHVHAVLEADRPAEHVLNCLKAHASRALNLAGLDQADRRRWARHGSTRYLWTRDRVSAAVRYVVSNQGEPMEVWQCSGLDPG